MTESKLTAEQRERLEAMVKPGQGTWDLSDNDVDALRAALAEIDRLSAHGKSDWRAACDALHWAHELHGAKLPSPSRSITSLIARAEAAEKERERYHAERCRFESELARLTGELMKLYPADTNGDAGVVEGVRAELAKVKAERDAAEERLFEAKAERDEWAKRCGDIISEKPGPTAEAYEKACADLHRHRARAEAAERERDEAREQLRAAREVLMRYRHCCHAVPECNCTVVARAALAKPEDTPKPCFTFSELEDAWTEACIEFGQNLTLGDLERAIERERAAAPKDTKPKATATTAAKEGA